jgi:hypothetical protein
MMLIEAVLAVKRKGFAFLSHIIVLSDNFFLDDLLLSPQHQIYAVDIRVPTLPFSAGASYRIYTCRTQRKTLISKIA